MTTDADPSAACSDAHCGHWVLVTGPPGQGIAVGVFAMVAEALPEGTVVAGDPPFARGNAWALHVPHGAGHDYLADDDEDDEDWDDGD